LVHEASLKIDGYALLANGNGQRLPLKIDLIGLQ